MIDVRLIPHMIKGQHNMSLKSALHCTALHCTALHCTALHCTALHCTALHCTALHCTALHCTALHCTALHCTALHCTAQCTRSLLLIWCSSHLGWCMVHSPAPLVSWCTRKVVCQTLVSGVWCLEVSGGVWREEGRAKPVTLSDMGG